MESDLLTAHRGQKVWPENHPVHRFAIASTQDHGCLISGSPASSKPTVINSFKPLIMLNLETIMNIVLTRRNAPDLGQLFILYYHFLQEVRSTLNQSPTMNNFTKAHCSFDEFYNAFIEKPRSSELNQPNLLHQLLELTGIDFDEFKEEL
jgi:hypothetical protein